MTYTKITGTRRCPWCQLQIALKAAPAHRCPAKPQTYFPEEPRFAPQRKPQPRR